MKKPNNILIVTILWLTVFFIAGCCMPETHCSQKVYQLKNETEKDVLLKFYDSSYHTTSPTIWTDTLYLDSNTISPKYSECPHFYLDSYFLDQADSLDIMQNDVVLIRYINTKVFTSKSPFDTENSYERVETSDGVVYVYTILNEDFE